MMKKIISAAAAAALMLSLSTAFAADINDISIVVNGEKIETDTAPVIINDRTMVPIRAIAEGLGCDVVWDSENQGVIISRNLHIYTLWIGYDTAFDVCDNALANSYYMDSVPIIVNDRTMLPIRAVAEMMDAEVAWDDASKTVGITVPEVPQYDTAGYDEYFIAFESALCAVRDKYRAYSLGESETVTGKIVLKTGEEMEFTLYPELAEASAANFISLAKSGFYNNTVFHRIIKDFVIQGGGYTITNDEFEEKAADSIYGEFLSNGYMNLLPHSVCAISMARTSDPDSASSQFFICDADCSSLNGSYAVFGYVTAGEDIIHKLASVQTDNADCPTEDIVIKEIIIN